MSGADPLRELAVSDANNYGMRIVLETRHRVLPDQLHTQIAEQIRPVSQFELKRLFDGSDVDPKPERGADLASFWLLFISGVAIKDMSGGIFDLCHHLYVELDLKSCQPDFPGGCEQVEIADASNQDIVCQDRGWHLRDIRAKQAWDMSGQRGRGIRIAHIDTGYLDHVDLDSARLRTDLGRDFFADHDNARDQTTAFGPAGHGTAVGSVMMSGGTLISAPTEGEGGTGAPGLVTGVAPEAELVPLRAADSPVNVYSTAMAQAIYYAIACGSHVVTITLSSRPMRCLDQAIKYAIMNNVIVLATAGNKGSGSGALQWPGRYASVIAPVSVDHEGKLWAETRTGNGADLLVPGEGVWHASDAETSAGHRSARPGASNGLAVAVLGGAAALWLGHFGTQNIVAKARKLSIPVQKLFLQALMAFSYRHHLIEFEGKEFAMLNVESLLSELPPVVTAPSKPVHHGSVGRSDLHKLADAVCAALLPRQDFGRRQWHHEILTILSDMEHEGHPLSLQWKCAESRYFATNPQLLSGITMRGSKALCHVIETVEEKPSSRVVGLD